MNEVQTKKLNVEQVEKEQEEQLKEQLEQEEEQVWAGGVTP